VAYLPWLPQLSVQVATTQTLQESFPGFANMMSLGILHAPAFTIGKFIFGILPVSPNLFHLTLLTILAFLSFGFLGSYPTPVYRYNRKKILLISAMLVLPLLLATILATPFPILQPRRVIFLLPFFYLLISYLLFGLTTNQKTQPWSHLLLSVLLITNLYSLFVYFNTPSLQREDWRGSIARVVESVPHHQTLVVFTHLADFSPWRWYAPDNIAVLSLQTRNLTTDEARFNLLVPYLDNYRYIVVFDYLRGIVDPDNLIGERLLDNGFVQWRDVGSVGVGGVNIYVRED
jgi:hypothetical protein